jgi:class 3 adenylate cyclase/uncharacterized protein HemY
MGVVMYYLSDYTKALEFYHKAISIFEKIGDKINVISVLCNIGNVYSSKADYLQALEYMDKALNAYKEIGDTINAAIVMGNIGALYYLIGDYPHSLEYLNEALKSEEELDNKQGVANVLGNIGNIYLSLSDYPRALEYMQRSLATHKELGNKRNAASVMGNIGNIYLYLKNYDDSLKYMSESLAAHQEVGNKATSATVLCSIGIIYAEYQDYQKSLEYYKKSLSIQEELGATSGVAHALSQIGMVYSNKQFDGYDLSVAKEYLLKSNSMFLELGSKHKIYENHKVLSEVFEIEGDTATALYHYKQYHDIEKDVQSEETQKLAQRNAFERQIGEMQREQDVTDRILHNILPKEIAGRIRRGDQKIVDSYDSVSVLFADIVGFTKLSQRVSPEELVAGLDGIFNTFDRLADRHGCEKIKTIGDCYMVVAGLPERCDNHAERLALMALDMLKAIQEFPAMAKEGVSINMRIGIHSGSVVAGIIGKNKYAYDLWGDAVNTASRMESHGEPGKIHVSEEFTRGLMANSTGTNLHFVPRGELSIKGKGTMKTYFLE